MGVFTKQVPEFYEPSDALAWLVFAFGLCPAAKTKMFARRPRNLIRNRQQVGKQQRWAALFFWRVRFR